MFGRGRIADFGRRVPVPLLACVGWVCSCRTHSQTETGAEATIRPPDSSPRSNLEGFPGCPKFFDGKRVGRIANPSLTEASDLAASAKNPGVLWSHNDSGRKPRLFAMSVQGQDLGTYLLESAEVVDWEDLSLGPGPVAGESYLYVGDIGANRRSRRSVVVYRVEEPDVRLDQKPKKHWLRSVSRFEFTFPDFVSHDAESLMVDPMTGDLYLVTKPRTGAAAFYRRKAPLEADRPMELELVSSFAAAGVGSMLPSSPTSADISRDGSMILVRTYTRPYLWPREPAELIPDALGRTPCRAPLHAERQGESIAFAPDSRGYYPVTEGPHAVLFFYERWQQ